MFPLCELCGPSGSSSRLMALRKHTQEKKDVEMTISKITTTTVLSTSLPRENYCCLVIARYIFCSRRIHISCLSTRYRNTQQSKNTMEYICSRFCVLFQRKIHNTTRLKIFQSLSATTTKVVTRSTNSALCSHLKMLF